MPSVERDVSRDSVDRHLRHQTSASSDGGRAIVPMWDSSDPERAPPPLPMNPSSPSVATSRPNTSSAIQSAHAALTEKARESGYTPNVSPKRIEQSPERSLIKGAAHKRMQSLQTGHVRDLGSFLEGGGSLSSPRSPEKAAGRPATPHTSKDFFSEGRSPEKNSRFLLEGASPEKEKEKEKEHEKDSSRCTTPTPTPRGELTLRNTPKLRPSLRRPPQSILGENTPPQSATMLALQNMASKDHDGALANVTNGSSSALVRTPHTFDAISNQILSLTSIATSLQREMFNLSRRSKDNATDLVSLKEATNARDEDIRKSLRELVNNLNEASSRSTSSLHGAGPGGLYLDNKAHNYPGSRGVVKNFVLPRIPSPNSFAASLDRDSMSSPSSYAPDAVTSIALLEKILREMGSKEGQELLVGRLIEVSSLIARDGSSTAKKLDELLQLLKVNTSQAIVLQNGGGSGGNKSRNFNFGEPPRLELDFDTPSPRGGPMTQRVGALLAAGNKENAGSSPRASEIINEDIIKIIRTIKDSVAQGGGLTAEVKALVRELRGEVLGMGREIGRKLDEANVEAVDDAAADKEHVARVVQEGLEELKGHMDRILHEHRRQSASSIASRNTVDYQEIYNAMRSAINEQNKSRTPALEKEDILEAVKEAWENYKPEIEVQQFGLEREELLTCLKEGIQEFSPKDTGRDVGATRDEVFKAVVEGLKHFSPPRVDTEANLSREEILDAVRECLEEFEFPAAPAPEPIETGITRDDMLDAVREGLHTFDFPTNDARSRDIDDGITRDDVLEAVKEGLKTLDVAALAANTTALSREVGESLTRDDVYDAVKAAQGEIPPMDGFSEQVMDRLHEIMESMQTEFRAVSDEAKQNVAANGRDTEQVLDATKDGFEKLRSDIESYVDRATGAEMKGEILDNIRQNFDSLRSEIDILLAKESNSPLDTVRGELESIRESMSTALVPANTSAADKDEILEALREGIDSLRADIERPRHDSNESVVSGTGEILDALHDGLNNLRTEVEKIVNKPVDMTVNYEILDTLKLGLEGVRADIDRLREGGYGERAVAEVNDTAVIAADGLKRNDIENLEVLITQLRIKVEALETMPPPIPQPVPGSLSRNDLTSVEEMLKDVQASVADFGQRDRSADDTVKREDVEAIETLLRNTKAKIDEMDPEQAVKKDQIDAIELLIGETRDNVSGLATHLEDVSKKDDVNVLESLVRDVLGSLEEMKERATKESEDLERVTKTDVEAVEAVCLDVKTAIDQMLASDIAALASRDDVKNLEELVKEFKDRIETHADTNATMLEERQAETVGVGELVKEVKTFLEEFKDAVQLKLDDGATSVENVAKLLEPLGETINQNANITDDIRELFEAMKSEFEKSNAGVVGSKLESDEKFQQTWDKFDTKLDEKFNDLMAKYDDAQGASEASADAAKEKNANVEAALLETKTATDDLKLLTDTLGTTFNEAVTKIDESSKTVFGRVHQTFTRVEETHADAKAEHQLTREQVFKTLNSIDNVQDNVTEFNPKILESIKDVLLIVGQHYEHSKTSVTTLQDKISERPAMPDIPLIKEAPVVEKYDDTNVHEKLDKLVDHMHAAGKSFAQLDMLDKIHQQVMDTAAEVSQFVSNQTQRIADEHEDKEKAVEAATIALEKRLAQKEHVEATVVGLREEEDHLKESVSILKAEQEDLAHQKMRLSADVSSLETALRLRREELQAMEGRAEGLERRILEGVIDHSRALLLSKQNKGRDAMSRKRVPSHATSTTGSITSNATSRTSNTTQSAVGMAMGGNRVVLTIPGNIPGGPSRRILSLNQITHNVPTGGFKRSHSVKAPGGAGALRKSSWGGSLSNKYGDLNKENLALNESEEDEDNASDVVSEDEKMRRSSRGTTILTSTGTGVSESIDEGTEWTGSVTGDEHSDDGTELEQENHQPVVLYGDAGQVA